jgi:hypothetical protein
MESNELQKMLTDAAKVITKQSGQLDELMKANHAYEKENQSLQQKIAGYQRKADCEKLAGVMIDKGLINPTDYRAKVQEYYDGNEDVSLLMKAAELVVPQTKGIEFVGESMEMSADEIAVRRFSSMSD